MASTHEVFDGRTDAMVLFGATGDLAHKKIFPALYEIEADGKLDGPVIGVSSSEGDDEFLRDRVRASVDEQVDDVDRDVLSRLVERVRYTPGDYREDQVFDALAEALDGIDHPLFYLAIPPRSSTTWWPASNGCT